MIKLIPYVLIAAVIVFCFFFNYAYLLTYLGLFHEPESAISIPSSTPRFVAQHMPPLLERNEEQLKSSNTSFIKADLSGMEVSLYATGTLKQTYPILKKGKEHDFGETAMGLFKIRYKETNHFSNLGRVYMPFNMPFEGNYSIHGWPYYADGTPTQNSFSSGCINLSIEASKDLFSKTVRGMPVLVTKDEFKNDDFTYQDPLTPTVSHINAEAYLAADLKSGFIFAKKNSNEILPIASVTKLMTALVASEYNLLSFKFKMQRQITITPAMTAPIGQLRGLEPGKRFTYFELLYPLLIPSSNDAAEALASTQGISHFISLMNERAASLGMQDTAYNDVYGYDPRNVSTANDLYYLAKYIYTSRRWILDITKGKRYEQFGPLSFDNLKNQNLFYDDPAFIGGKVGATPIAERTGVFLFTVKSRGEERPIVIIILKSVDNKGDTEKVLSWIKKSFADQSNIASTEGRESPSP